MKKVIYTAIFGDYDTLRDPLYINEDYDYVCFTDQDIKSRVWRTVKIYEDYNPKVNCRKIKIRPHFYLPEYDFSIWMDGNIQQTKNINEIACRMTRDMMLMRHPHRRCIYEEMHACIKRGKDHATIMRKQIQRYKHEGYPENNGLNATGLLFRNHNKEEVKAFSEAWWDEVRTGSIRDQLSFNYCLNGMKIDEIPFKVLTTHFNHHTHK